jgi:hypothetical protein
MRESVLLLRRVGLFCAFLVLIALVTIAVSASASRMRPHSGKPRKPDPCAVHKRPSASAARRHKLVCRTRTRRVKLSVHDAHGPYATPPLQKEIDEATAPRLPVGPYRPRNGPKVLLTAPSTATGSRDSTRAFSADNTQPVNIASNVDPSAGGLGAASADQESSEAVVGDLVFFTSNWRAGYSTNDGRTFNSLSLFGPSAVFPSAAGGFCCDQVVIYAPRVDQVFWLLQYANDANGENTIRLAWASPASIKANPTAWSYIDYNSKALVGAGNCLDQPHVGLAPTYLLIQINQCKGGTVSKSLLMRMHLLDVNKSQVTTDSAVLSPWSARPARTADKFAYYVAQLNTSTLRFFRWEDNSNQIAWDDVGIPTIANGNWTSNTPGGVNWLNRMQNSQGTAVTGVTLAGGKVWALWAAARSTTDAKGNLVKQVHAQPAIEGAIIKLKGDGSADSASGLTYYNDNFAVSQPDVATNADGEVGLSYMAGGSGFYPAHGLGIITGTPQFNYDITGNTDNDPSVCAPACPGDPAGDYTTVGVDSPYNSCFIASGVAHETASSAPSPRSKPRVSVFARLGTPQCLPPPTFLGPSSVSLACPGQVDAGNAIVTSGHLTPVRSGTQIQVKFTWPDGSTDTRTVTTDGSSNYLASEPTTAANVGSWRVQASWGGDADTSGSSSAVCLTLVVVSAPNKQPSSINANVGPTSDSSQRITCPNDQNPYNSPDLAATTIEGTISPARPNVPVTINYVPTSAGTLNQPFSATVTTDSNSHYSSSAFLAYGTWSIEAHWNGDAQYQAATSPTCTVFQKPHIT